MADGASRRSVLVTRDVDPGPTLAEALALGEERIPGLGEALAHLAGRLAAAGAVLPGLAAERIRVQGLGEREVVRMLDRELDQLHRLVQEDSVKRVGGRRLSHYRFRHNLLQRYLYNVLSRSEREMLHEDFAQMLNAKPGCYVLIGNGTEGHNGRPLHNPGYDFNDDVLATGAAWWVKLTENCLPPV